MRIDLNSDLGENSADAVVSDDAAMLRIVSSANVSCGVHAGDEAGIAATLADAAARGVCVGAHPSYDDRANFGRVPRDVAPATLQRQVEAQLGALVGWASAAGTTVAYVKPHGALYNTIATNARHGAAVIAAIRAVDPDLAVLTLAGSGFVRQASAAGLRVAEEAFADRGYRPDGSLVPRTEPRAVLHDPDAVAARVLRLVTEGVVEASDGSMLRLRADSVCVHGDSPSAVAMARATRDLLVAQGVRIAPFAG